MFYLKDMTIGSFIIAAHWVPIDLAAALIHLLITLLLTIVRARMHTSCR